MRSKDVLQLLRVTRQTLSKYDENSEEKPRERRARTNAHEALTQPPAVCCVRKHEEGAILHASSMQNERRSEWLERAGSV